MTFLKKKKKLKPTSLKYNQIINNRRGVVRFKTSNLQSLYPRPAYWQNGKGTSTPSHGLSLFQCNIGHITNDSGIAVPYADSSVTVGKYGPIVLTDVNLIEQLGHFNRERIPERVVHAKGAGAFGYFQVSPLWTISKRRNR